MGLAIAAVVAVFLATRHGPGLTSDSVTYLEGSRQLRADPTTLFSLQAPPGDFDAFPPLYSAALAAVGVTGMDEGRAARVLGAAVVVAAAALGSLLVAGVAGRARAAVAAVALVVSDGYLVLLGAYAMADGLFVALALAALVLLHRALAGDDPPRWMALVGAGAVAGAAGLTRTVGLALVPALVVFVILVVAPRRRRGAAALAVAGLAVLPVAVWTAFRGSASGGRELAWHPPPIAAVADGLRNVAKWLVPERAIELAPGLVEVSVLLGVTGTVVGAVAVWWRSRGDRGRTADAAAVTVLAVWAVGHTAMVLVTRTLLDASLPVDQRLLYPAWVATLLAVVITVPGRALAERVPVRALGAAAVLVGTLWTAQTAADLRAAASDGLGLARPELQEGELVEGVEGGPGRYTNGAELAYLFAGEVVSAVPTLADEATGRELPGYRAEIERLADDVRLRDGAVYWFDAVERSTLPDLDRFLADTGLRIVDRASDGVVVGP